MCHFTVAICTYRRTDMLPATLESLASIDKPDAQWDVLIVDNECSDQVKKIVDGFSNKLPIRYTSESKLGIANARNRAVNQTDSEIIIFTDDDVIFDKNWLCAMVNAVKTQPQCSFWGGRIEPTWSIPKPRWFDVDRCPMLGDSIVRYDQGHDPRPWQPKKDPEFYTCNLALRTDAIREAGMFDADLGHQGDKRGGGEDSWMIRTISRQGGQGWYAADAWLNHPVPPSRVTRRHARAFAWWQGRVGVDMLRREHADSDHPKGKTPRWLYRVATEQFCASIGKWIAGTITCTPGLGFAGQFGVLYSFSKLWHAMKS